MKLRKFNAIQLSVIILCLLILAFVFFELLFRNKMYQHSKASSVFKKGNHKKAEMIWQKTRGDRDPIPDNSLGKAQYRLGKYQDSEKSQAEALKKKKDSSRYNFDRGNAFYRQEKLDEALDAYREAMLLDPDDQDAKSNYELVLYRKNYEPPQAPNGKNDPPKQPPEPENKPPQNTDEQNKFRNQLDALDQKEARERQNQSQNKTQKGGGKWW